MEKPQLFAEIKKKVRQIVDGTNNMNDIYCAIVKLLDEKIPYYDWTGFYFMKEGELVLGPYVGKPTEHVRIQVGQGICGQAAAKRETIIVDDVAQEDNYLACSLETKSEIVVPIEVDGEMIGEIDIDSDQLAAFDDQDADLLEYIAQLIAEKVRSVRSS